MCFFFSTKKIEMKIKKYVFNPVQENTFVIYDETGKCAIIDAGCMNNSEFDVLDGFINSNELTPVKLINTHGHFDHILGVEKCREAYKLKWEAHDGDAFLIEAAPAKVAMYGMPISPIQPADVELSDGDIIEFGNSKLKVIYVPGHSPGSVCLYEEKSKILIAGDVLFKGSIGRTDIEQGDYDTLISGIKNKLFVLPDDVIVYPGHGPSTTIGYEKATNPFLQ